MQNYRESQDNFRKTYMALYIRLDKKYQIYERQIYSILDLFGDTGGLVEAVHVFGLLLVSFIASRQFEAAMIRKVY